MHDDKFGTGNSDNTFKKPNSLIKETSPYLLQHAYNPVHWYTWGEEALETARKKDMPIFLSIGYSACHWCHVMAHESFEDEQIAQIMNENFVNIKVDREERPDIDDIYQRVCQLAAGTGGWPLSVFLSPDQKPFYVGTYFPKESRYGMPGFGTILIQLADAYKNRKNEIKTAIDEFMQALSGSAGDVIISNQAHGNLHAGQSITNSTSDFLNRSILDEAAIGLLQMADNIYGGFGQAPKFPNPSNLLFLLRYYDLSSISRFRDFVIFTADKMAAGGIYDHIGGGFARYSTDQKWLVPHFEKMLYDNALLVGLYSEIYQITADKKYLQIVEHILDYVLREMTSKQGGFYSAQDADSEGEEGKYYLWSKKELFEILDKESAEIFCHRFGVTQGGNFEGRNILNVRTGIKDLSRIYGKSPNELERIIEESKNKLYKIRDKREKPGKDEKILTSWNALMISALMKGYRISGNKKYYDAAIRAIEFIEKTLGSSDGRLKRTYKQDIAKLNAYLEDYAFYVNALLDAFETHSNSDLLEKAIIYNRFMLDHFWDEKEYNLYLTSDDHERLIVRTKNLYDLAIPSGNSVAASNLLRLYHFTHDQEYLKKSEGIMVSASKSAAMNPFGFGQLLMAIYSYVKRPVEVSIVQRDNEIASNANDYSIRKWINTRFIPNLISASVEVREINKLRKYQFFGGIKEDMLKEGNSEVAIVCRNFSCSLPLSNLAELEKAIRPS